MRGSELDSENRGIDLPQEIYSIFLEVIDGIPFTRREIDIIACIMGGKTTKKTASFLAISPKTVETHIRNIMLKLGINARENFTDFAEKSGKYFLLKKHYISLLIQKAFESELDKISSFSKQKTISCVIVCDEEKVKSALFSHLKKHLEQTGIIITVLKIGDNKKEDIAKKLNASKTKNIIYFSPLNSTENTNLINENEFLNVKPIIVAEQNNYYFSVFEVLKKLIPQSSLETYISRFTEYKNKLIEPNFIPRVNTGKNENKSNLIERFFSFESFKTKSKGKQWLLGIVACFIMLVAGSFIFVDTHPSNKNFQKTAIVKHWHLPRQDHIFVGRKKLLQDLHAQLLQGFKVSKKRNNEKGIHALTLITFAGLGGIGKTQLALQYVHHTKIPYILKAWFNAENIQQLDSQYIEFAAALGYREEDPSIKTALPYVKDWLSNNPGWLLVFDNVNEYEEIKPYLPEKGGSIILTTRQQNWPNGFNTLNIDVMTEEESIELVHSLIQRKRVPQEEEAVKQLAKILGYLPLALAQASAYIHQTQITITEYLGLYKRHEQILLADNTLPEGTNSFPIAITWDISLNAIAKEANEKHEPNLALNLLNACAYLAPEKIPNDLLLGWIKETYPNITSPELVLPKLIGQLRQYSMIHREKDDISVHRLVQAIIRYQQKNSSKQKIGYQPLTLAWYDTIIKSVHSEFSRKTQVLEDEARQKNLLPHLQLLLHHYKELWPNNSELNLVPILNDIGMVFFLMGEAKIAKTYYERSLLLLEQRYGKDHIEVVWNLDQLGKTYKHLGEAKQAKVLHERALKIKENYYDKDNIEIAFTLDQLGRCYRYLVDAKQAKILHERALKIKEQHYGKDNIEMTSTLDQLANDYYYLGDAKQAKALHERALKIKEQYYGKDHLKVAFTLSYLGREYRYLGDAKQAKVLHERALKIKEQHYGKDHILMTWTIDQLGLDCRYLGEIRRAKAFHERALRMKEQYFGKDHVETAWTLDRLGSIYRDLGDIQRAKELHERALNLKEQYHGKDHIKVLWTLDQLGRDYRELGDAQQAKEFHERVLKVREEYYGKDHIEVALILDQLGRDHYSLGDAREAKALHERALMIKEQYYGKDHIKVAHTLCYLGTTYTALDMLYQGKSYLEKSLNIRERYYGVDHPLVADTLIELGNSYKALKEPKQAQRHLKRALKIRERFFGQDHPLTLELKQAISQG